LGNAAAAEAALKKEIERLAGEHYAAFAKGVAAYQQSSFKRNIAAPKTLWREGTTRLLDFGTGSKNAVLVIPSLINRYHVLDIEPEASFLRRLAKRGYRPLLVDWGEPGRVEKDFTVDDYIKRLTKALAQAYALNKGKLPVIGYCMGGVFTAALAALSPTYISKLVFLATPWDFHAGEENERQTAIVNQLVPLLKQWGELPIDVMQAFFIMLAPFAVLDKFIRFGGFAPKSPEAKSFVLLEDWVNDGVPLPKEVARQCLNDWYASNQTGHGKWKVMGKAIKPSQVKIPSLHVIPARDRIVPPESAEALAKQMTHATVLRPSFGHVSMMAHRNAATALWPQIFDWLATPQARH
jgi:polyhydroxyalkanoate synthase